MTENVLYRLGLAGAVLGITLSAGCSSPSRPDVAPIVLRFIADDPERSFASADLLEEQQVLDWQFRTERDLSSWRLGFLEKSFPDPNDYAVLTSIRRMPRLYRRILRTANSIDLFRLTGRGLRHEVTLHWHGQGERHSSERVVRAQPKPANRRGIKQWDFAMASHPLWTGFVQELRMDPVALPNQEFQLYSLVGIKFRPIPDRLDAANGSAWKVDLKRDVRNAILVAPGRPVERELVVPDDASFHFAYGLELGPVPPPTAEPIGFRVAVASGTADPRTVFEDTIAPTRRGSGAPGWKDGAIDLTAYAGERVRLIVETSATESWKPWHSLPFWANPEVIRRLPRTPPGEDPASKPSPPNVVLISIDTLRADRLSLYGHDRRTSPNIDAWARRAGVTFQNAIVQASWTLPSHVSIFTGLDAIRHQANYGPAPTSLTMLAEILRSAGYTTAGITGGGYVGPEYGFAQGFDSYRYWGGDSLFEMTVGVHHVIEWLEANADRPFFLFFHTFEVHSPFRAREPYASEFGSDLPDDPKTFVQLAPIDPTAADGFQSRSHLVWPDRPSPTGGTLSPAQRASILSLYDSGIAHADELLARLFAHLRELKLERDTLVILTSDHGEAFGEHDRVGHGYLSDDNLRVPLVLAFPRRLRGGRMIASQVRSIDILPTVLELLRLPPLPDIDGASLVALLEADGGAATPRHSFDAWTYAASTNFGMSLRIDNRTKFIFNNTPWEPIRLTGELYRLEDDPAELHNVVVETPESAGLRARVVTTLAKRPGFRVGFTNATKQPYRGTMRAPFINEMRVKTHDMDCACAAWADGQMRFTVPPGETYALLLENVEPGALTIDVTMDIPGQIQPASARWDLEPATLTTAAALTLQESIWSKTEGDLAPETGIVVWWEDEAPAMR